MAFKAAAFEPKDARIVSEPEYENIEEEDDEFKEKRRKKTGTQALVEFLNTTSPEEFSKPPVPTKRSSFFGRRRKSSTPLKKNYIDIISSPFKKTPMLPRRESCYSSSSTTAVRHLQLVSSILLEDEKSTLQALDEEESDDDHDVIERGLRQRLNRYRVLGADKPSDVVTKVLTREHITALENMVKQCPKNNKQVKVRHVQVQTIDCESDKQEEPKEKSKYTIEERYHQMELELKHERLLRQRLQATLEETVDHFEVLSGLAYKKLREVWEEKIKWENACMQIKERCWQDHQQQILGQHHCDKNGQQDDASLIIE